MMPSDAWIERCFNLFPDGGSGATEALLLAVLLAGTLCLAVSHLSRESLKLRSDD